MKLAVDIDAVLADIGPSIIKWHNDTHGTDHEEEHMESYEFKDLWNCSFDEATKKIYKYYETPYLQKVKPVPKAKQSINLLNKTHELTIVTSRHKAIMEETHRWLNEHYPKMFSEIVFASEFDQAKQVTKATICRERGIKTIVEDHMPTARECAEAGMTVLLMSKPWNKNHELHDNMIRVNGWKDAVNYLHKNFKVSSISRVHGD